jgi:hypothetical protein
MRQAVGVAAALLSGLLPAGAACAAPAAGSFAAPAAGSFAAPAAGSFAAPAAQGPAAPSPPTVAFKTSLTPERLGAGTTIAISFQVSTPPGGAPLPLAGMRVMLPHGLSIIGSELGLEHCQAARLEALGPAGCPPNSAIGRGQAVAVLPFGPQLVFEHVAVTLFAGPWQQRTQTQTLLVYASGEHPALTYVVFPGVALPASGPFGSLIETSMPPVPGLPGGPDVAVVRFATTIGPQGILYRERAHGKLIRFHPEGAVLPPRCPRGGFPFLLTLSFSDGTQVSGHSSVPCPRSHAGRKG